MRILHVITSLRTGGAERLVVDLAKQMRAMGDAVEILLFDGTETPLKAEAESTGISVHALGVGWRAMRNPLLVFKLKRFLRNYRFEVVHTHNTACQLLTAIATLHMSVLLITTEHNTDNRRRQWLGYRAMDRCMYQQYRRIICVSEETKAALVSYLNSPQLTAKMDVISNGIDVQKVATASPASDLSMFEGFKLLMVSAFRPQEDQQTVIRAMQFLPLEYMLFLAGGSETEADRKCLKDCEQLVEELGLADRVRFLGIRSDVPQLLAGADAVVLSTAYEGMSLSMLEAMASGRPFLASDVSGVHNLVAGAGLLFPYGDDRQLAALIRKVCENPALAELVGEKCRARALQFDVVQTAKRYNDTYKILLLQDESNYE